MLRACQASTTATVVETATMQHCDQLRAARVSAGVGQKFVPCDLPASFPHGMYQVARDGCTGGMRSLADLCRQILGLELPKPEGVRRGNWEKRPLTVDQLEYAALDSYAGLRLWQVPRLGMGILRNETVHLS